MARKPAIEEVKPGVGHDNDGESDILSAVDDFLGGPVGDAAVDDTVRNLMVEVVEGDPSSVARFLARLHAEGVFSFSAIVRQGDWLTRQVATYLSDDIIGKVRLRNIYRETQYKEGRPSGSKPAPFSFKVGQAQRRIKAAKGSAVLQGDAHVLIPRWQTVEPDEVFEVKPLKALTLLRRWSAAAAPSDINPLQKRHTIADALREVGGEIQLVNPETGSTLDVVWRL